MTIRSVRSFLGLICAVFLTLAVASSASGADSDTPSGPKESTSLDTQPVDVTGDAALSEERDRLQSLLAPLEAMDGGLSWDSSTQVLTVRMTSDAALDEAERIIGGAQTELSTEFVRVDYSARELNELADRLLSNQEEWAESKGIGGGFDPVQNRVILQVDPTYKEASTLIQAIEKLQDARVSLQLIDSVEGWAPESRVDDFAPWTAGATIDSSSGGCTLGWTWKRWGSGQVVGSTARHCANLTWTNNGTYVGTVFQSSPSADSALMSGTSYSPTVVVTVRAVSAGVSTPRAIVAITGDVYGVTAVDARVVTVRQDEPARSAALAF